MRFWRFKFPYEYFKKTILNQAKTILYEPPDWANYVAYMFLIKDSNADINDRIIRMSPMIHSYRNALPEVKELLDKLYQLDMDITEDSEMNLIKECFNSWANDKILNQPIDYRITRNNDLIYLQGDKYFSEAIKKW